VCSEWVEYMLFDYVAPGFQPGRVGVVWSQFPLQPLVPGVLTPFSYSVLAELTSRGWYVHYDRLGFDPAPRARIVRRHKGHVYYNVSLAAQMEADHAGLEPPVLQINQQRQPVATWEKPGFLAGFKVGRAQKKMDDVLADYGRQMGTITEAARAWYLKTQDLRWSQAEVLQVMEEIERVGVESMAAYLAARHTLERLYIRLLADLEGGLPTIPGAAQRVVLINNALGDLPGLVESAMSDSLLGLVEVMRGPDQLAWLKAGDFANWRSTLPSKQAVERVEAFIGAFGHRAIHEGEIARPRWAEDPSVMMQALLTYIESPSHISSHKEAVKLPNHGAAQKLFEALPAPARKQGEQTLQKIADAHKLQSSALNALAYIWGGTRRWALAAAREAMADKRLHAEREIFFFELEEIKEMMTGEWNISSLDEIRATLAKRQTEHAAAQQEAAPDILADDAEGNVTHQGLPGVAGQATGPLQRLDETQKDGYSGAVVGAELLDSGCALVLPLANGFVAATGTPLDPFVAAASAWQRPVVIGMGKSYAGLVGGAQTVVDANAESVKVNQQA
jgi:hypothetical protein